MNLTQCTALELLALYRSGAASPVEATQSILTDIERLNPRLLAYCLVDEAQALASARASEARWHAHRHSGAPVGALEGVPASIKDLILTRAGPPGAAAWASRLTRPGTSTPPQWPACAKPARSCSAKPPPPSTAAKEKPTPP